MIEGAVLEIIDVTKHFDVGIDVSDDVLGGFLLQSGHPIKYENRKLNAAVRKRNACSGKLPKGLETIFTRFNICCEDGQLCYLPLLYSAKIEFEVSKVAKILGRV